MTRHLFSLSLWQSVPLIQHTVAITQGGAIQLANNGTDGVQGLQTLTMTNAAAAQPGATILQYAQTSDGQQILVPSNQVVVQGERILFSSVSMKWFWIGMKHLIFDFTPPFIAFECSHWFCYMFYYVILQKEKHFFFPTIVTFTRL